jgi:hypothetical protein
MIKHIILGFCSVLFLSCVSIWNEFLITKINFLELCDSIVMMMIIIMIVMLMN